MLPGFRDPERCTKCGGECCFLYTGANDDNFKDWTKQLDGYFIETGADKIPPVFDQVEAHFNKDLRERLMAQGINPDRCRYLGKEGRVLPWDLRPKCCREFMCPEWKRDMENKS